MKNIYLPYSKLLFILENCVKSNMHVIKPATLSTQIVISPYDFIVATNNDSMTRVI